MARFFSDLEQGFWVFQSNTKVFGQTQVQAAKQKLEMLHQEHKNLLVLSDDGVMNCDFYTQLIPKHTVFQGVLGADGAVEPANQVIDQCVGLNIDGIIAIGGGSVMDTAKAVALALANHMTLDELLKTTPAQKALPLTCVPTTFGTGSEVNSITHLTLAQEKYSLKKSCFSPENALLVGEIALKVPKKLRILSMLDAQLHAFEVASLKRERSPFQDALANEALTILERKGEVYGAAPDLETAMAIATASCFGGILIENSRTGLIHTLATPFATLRGIPHHLSLVPFIEPVLQWQWDHYDERLKGHAQKLLDALAWSKPYLAAVNPVKKEEIAPMVEACLKDTVIFKENIKKLEAHHLTGLYEAAAVAWT